MHNKLNLLSLITDQICAGDIIVFDGERKPKFIFKIQNNVISQIYGDCIEFDGEYVLEVAGLNKLKNINNYLYEVFQKLTLIDLIYYKNDLINIEKELIRYLLNTKSTEKCDLKKIRSIIFKNCKDVKVCEKIFLILKTNRYTFFDNHPGRIIVNFTNMSVQYQYD